MATKWFSMDSAPKDRDFLAELENGYITRGRLRDGGFYPDTQGYGSVPPPRTDWPLGWCELPTPMKKKPKAKGGYTEEFERDVWGPYPRKEGTSKIGAFKKFQALGDADRALCKAAIPLYARSKAGTDQQYIKHLEFFISGKLFETIGAANVMPSAPPAPVDWDTTLRIYKRTNNWNTSFGAAPGLPGCKVPLDALRRAGIETVE